jgi:Ser/Thr protein kinase RdoA (MazF antagonist)
MPLSLSTARVATALAAWSLPARPVVSELGEGFGGEAWLVECNASRFVAKIAYDTQAAVEVGLRMSEIVERHGIPSGAPLRTADGALSVLVEHPPGHHHPLALLRFVPGRPLDLTDPRAQRLTGDILGRVHRILHQDGGVTGPGNTLFTYLTEDQPEVFSRYPWLRPLLRRAVAEVRAFEALIPVTYGCLLGDYLQLLREETTGQLGIIDWGAAHHGPLLFDLALAVDQFREAGAAATDELIASYRAEAPITPEEMAGLDRYLTLLWARQARYFAWRLAHDVTQGEPDSAGREETLAAYRRALEQKWGAQT